MIGISTSWRTEVTDSGREVIESILDLGIEGVELEYRVGTSMLEEMLPYLKRHRVSTLSLHNIVPLPESVPKRYADGEFVSLSSPDEEERKTAVKYAAKTMELAQRLEARAVVLHLGKVPMDGSMDYLRRLYDEGRISTEEGRAYIAQQKELRRAKGEGHVGAALKSLDRLAGEAVRRELLLGIENRYGIHDFPNPEELRVLFKELQGAPVGFWYDIGHATTQENLGLGPAAELLEAFGALLVGVHLHGCRGYADHLAPGSGEENYAPLKKYLKPATLRVIEAHWRASREELIQGVEFLRGKGIDG